MNTGYADKEATDCARGILGESDPRFGKIASVQSARGLILLKAGKAAEAEPLVRDSLAFREKAEPDAWTTFNSKSLLGGVLLGKKDFTEAEPLLVAGYEGMKKREDKIPNEGKTRLTEALERLVQLYKATDKKDEAAKWQKELEAQKKPNP
jgi:hypothetical protein